MKKNWCEGTRTNARLSPADIYAFAFDRHGYVLLCILIFLYYLLSPYQLFPRPGWVDPAIYAGHMMELSKIVLTYGISHMSGRLAYNALGYWLYDLAGSQWGHYLGIAIYLCIALGSVYQISKKYFSVYVTRVSIAFVAVSPLFVNSLTHNYPDGASISLVLAVVALLLKGHRENSKSLHLPWLVAGATTALIYFIHPMGVISCACALVAFVSIYLPRTKALWAYLKVLAASYIGGALIVLSSFVVAGRIIYRTNNIAHVAAAKFISGRQKSLGKAYMYPIEDWLPEASRLWWAALIVLLAAWGWWFSRGEKISDGHQSSEIFGRRQFMKFSALYLVLFFCLLAFSDVFGASTFLQHHHYASHILAPVFIVVIGFIGIGLAESHSGYAKTAYIFAILGQWGLLEVWIHSGSPPPNDGVIACLIVTALAVMVIAFKMSLARLRNPCCSWEIPFSSAQVLWLPAFLFFSMICQTANSDTRHALKDHNSPSYQAEFLAANSLSKAIWVQSEGTPVYFWFNREALNEDLDRAKLSEVCTFSMRFGPTTYRFNAYDDISSRFQWDKANWDTAFPEVGIRKPRPPNMHGATGWPITIAVLSTKPEHAVLARSVLDNYAFHVTGMTSLGQWVLPCTPEPVSVTLISLSSWDYGWPNQEKEK